jgi:DNA ligase-1
LKTLLGDEGFGPIVRVETQVFETTPLTSVEQWYKNRDEIDSFYELWLEQGYEGQMIRLDAPYQQGRRGNELMKRKEFESFEYRVTAMYEGTGNWEGCTRKFDCVTSGGIEFGADVVGTQAALRKLWQSGECPDWSTVEHFKQLTPDGRPRFGKAKDWGKGSRVD